VRSYLASSHQLWIAPSSMAALPRQVQWLS
jgi:hypothetical protein